MAARSLATGFMRDVDGDGAADFSAQLLGTHAMTKAYFIL